MAQVKELSDKFEVLKLPKDSSGDGGRISQRDILSSSITGRLLDAIYVKEVWLPLHPQHTDRWTELGTYQDVVGSINSINFDDFPDHNIYFEMIGFTDAGTGFWRLYNNTASAVVASSEISTTSTSSVRIRSGVLPKPSGTAELKIQHYISGGDASTEFVNSVMSRLVFRLP